MPSTTVENQKQVLSIPLGKIMPSPDQPRRIFRPGSIEAMTESLKAIGQETPIKVRPLTGEERAKYAPFEYMVIGGHRRREGAIRVGLEALDCLVLDVTAEQADLSAQMDNELDDLTWLDKDLAMARRHLVYGIGQREIARERGISPAMVNRAVTVANILTPASITLIDQTLNQTPAEEEQGVSPGNTQGGGYEVTRKVVLALATLDDPQKVEEALKVALKQQMTAAQAKKLVEWVKGGHGPEDYGKLGVNDKNNQPAEQPGEEALSGTGVASSLTPAYSAGIPRNDSKANLTPHPVLLPQGEKGATTPAAEALSTSDGTSGLAQVLEGFLKGGHSGVGKVLGGLAVGGVGAFLMSNGKRALGTLTRRYMMHGLVGVGALLVGVHFLPKGSHKPVQAPVVSASPALSPQGESNGSMVAALNGVITVPPDLEGRVDDASILAQDFTRRFYGYEYLILSNWTSHLQRDLAPEYSDAFFQAFMPPWKMDVITHRQLQAKFHPNQPAKLTALGPNGETFLVRGTASLQSDLTDDDKPVAEGPVALEVHITHSPGDRAEGRVSLVEELTPLAFEFTPAGSARVGPKAKKAGHRSASSKKPTDQGTDGAAKFVGDATGELAKKVLGF